MFLTKKVINVGDLVKIKSDNVVGVVLEKKISGRRVKVLSGKSEDVFSLKVFANEKEFFIDDKDVVKIS